VCFQRLTHTLIERTLLFMGTVFVFSAPRHIRGLEIDMQVIVTTAARSAVADKVCVIGFSECSYYNGEQPAKLETKRYQLRRAAAGGAGYSFVQDFDDAAEAVLVGEERQRQAKTAVYRVFDVAAL
jgi:hypothetical protein